MYATGGNPINTQPFEDRVRATAARIGQLEQERANEYIRLTRLGDMKGWDASMRVDAEFIPAIRDAQAEYEIAVAALHRASRGA